ncbi:hypothetical protein [Streptomyces sp. NPDC018031]|uniref:VMAP-C domain-containing protein n=1 Tax=Streptomyces sp. NPDC018031 TaxID=3365033 RepID=UPI0037924B84
MGWKQPKTEVSETGDAQADNGGLANTGILTVERLSIEELHLHGPGTPQAAPRLDQTAWDRLGALLGDRALPAHTHAAYRWAFEISGAVPPVGNGLPPGGLTEVVKDLDERQGVRPDVPLAVPFVRYLAARSQTADPCWARQLADWVSDTCARMAVGPVPVPPAAACPAVLHLRLEPALAEGRYWARMWLHRGSFEAVWESEDAPLPLDDVRRELGRQLLAAGAGHAGADAVMGVERVEFHVPFALLDHDFECWPLPIGRAGRPRALGLLYQVAVRCPEERDGVTEQLWRRKWDWYQAHGGRHPEAVRVVPEQEVTHALGDRLQADHPPVCVLAEVSGARLEDALDAVLDAGVPIAVWRRGGPPGAAGPGEGLVSALAGDDRDASAGGTGVDVQHLPRRLRDLRLRHTGAPEGPQGWHHPLALLWDDPDCRPQCRSLA